MKIALIGDSLTEGRPGVAFSNILKEQFPNITFINLGKPGESVISLFNRLMKTKLESDYDLAFLWIGVNDVYSKMLTVQAQPVAKDHDEFKDYYSKVLNLIMESSKKVVTVTPAIVGENIENASNNEIKELNKLIQSISAKHENVYFMNLNAIFLNHLSKVNSTDYISTKVIRVMMDIFYKKPSKIDKMSKKRGLHLTLDGIHLNSTGAKLVAESYASIINYLINEND